MDSIQNLNGKDFGEEAEQGDHEQTMSSVSNKSWEE